MATQPPTIACDCCGATPCPGSLEIYLGKRLTVLCHRCILEHGRRSRPCRKRMVSQRLDPEC